MTNGFQAVTGTTIFSERKSQLNNLGGMLMASEAKIRANNKSNKNNTTMICVRLSYNTDADIIKKLDEVDSKMGYIKELIRKDMQAQKK